MHNNTQLVVVQQGHGLGHIQGKLKLFHGRPRTTVRVPMLVRRWDDWLSNGLVMIVVVWFRCVVASIWYSQCVLQGTTHHEFTEQSHAAIPIHIHQEWMRSHGGIHDAVLSHHHHHGVYRYSV